MENLDLLRVDDRLIHGQVMTAWLKTIPAKEIMVIDDQVAKDEFMRTVIMMSAPSGVVVSVNSIDEAMQRFSAGLKQSTFALVKTPLTIKTMADKGAKFEAVNIGGLGMAPGRKPLFKNISASEEERQALRELIDKGVNVKIQIIPAEKITDVASLLK
ncbi:MAG TPA: PTS mannose/fructose/sorbose transporter subunit IIB [Firmicutes bacterium]|jgi:PTS system mannose-specific IIB component|nr:PTS mannose/fructose/sorbose transporter subunit IIB [Bacillota bacterium]